MSDINDTSPFGVPGEVLNEKDMDAPTGLLNMECFIRLAADIQKIRATEKTRIIYIFFNIEKLHHNIEPKYKNQFYLFIIIIYIN